MLMLTRLALGVKLDGGFRGTSDLKGFSPPNFMVEKSGQGKGQPISFPKFANTSSKR